MHEYIAKKILMGFLNKICGVELGCWLGLLDIWGVFLAELVA